MHCPCFSGELWGPRCTDLSWDTTLGASGVNLAGATSFVPAPLGGAEGLRTRASFLRRPHPQLPGLRIEPCVVHHSRISMQQHGHGDCVRGGFKIWSRWFCGHPSNLQQRSSSLWCEQISGVMSAASQRQLRHRRVGSVLNSRGESPNGKFGTKLKVEGANVERQSPTLNKTTTLWWREKSTGTAARGSCFVGVGPGGGWGVRGGPH